MHISKGDLIAGYPALEIRRLLRRWRDGSFDHRLPGHMLNVRDEDALALTQKLLDSKLIRKDCDYQGQPYYTTTLEGNAVALASAAKPVSRKTAERVLEEFMGRVHAINANPEYPYYVKTVLLFGSMLSEKPQVNDVDLGIELDSRAKDNDEFAALRDARIAAAKASGRNFRTFVEEICWPHSEIYLALKGRSRTISLHHWEQVRHLEGVQYRVLLGDPARVPISTERN